MIEKKGAVEDLEGILGVKGVDMVQFGPSDYGMSIGLGGQRNHPAVMEAYEHTIKTSIKMGVRPRAEIQSPKDADWYLERGVKDFNLSTDTAILAAFYKDQGSAMRQVMEQAEKVPA
jgi:4-hydroxy-2-oxoheptanedioate aldolase